jgi:hypothetical protein
VTAVLSPPASRYAPPAGWARWSAVRHPERAVVDHLIAGRGIRHVQLSAHAERPPAHPERLRPQPLLLIVGLLGVAWAFATGAGRLGCAGVATTVIGLTLLTFCEGGAFLLADSAYPTTRTDLLESTDWGVHGDRLCRLLRAAHRRTVRFGDHRGEGYGLSCRGSREECWRRVALATRRPPEDRRVGRGRIGCGGRFPGTKVCRALGERQHRLDSAWAWRSSG